MKWWLISAAVSWFLCLLAAYVLRWRGVIDRPNERSSHVVPTVRGGGLGILLAVMALALFGGAPAGSGITVAWVLGLAAILAAVSFVDDVRPVSAFARMAVHAALAAVCLWALGLGALPVVGLMLAWLWLCGYTNAFNFMDGINGLAATQAILTGAGTALVAIKAGAGPESAPVWLVLVVSGAAAGFLPHNFPRPRMFMGDVGSAVFGFLLAALALWIARDHGWGLLLPLGLLHANFVLDTGFTLVRRVMRGDRWHQSHREHFYQLLVRAGWSHERVTLVEAGLQLVTLLFAVGSVGTGVSGRIVALTAVLGLWLGFFFLAERIFRRASAG